MFLRLLWSLERCRAPGLTVVFVLCISDYDKLLPHLLLLEIGKMKAESDPAIDEYREVHGSKKRFVSKSVVIRTQPLFGSFFLLAEEALGKGDFCLLGHHLV